MIPGAYTWDALGSLEGNVLVVINSEDADAVAALFAALDRHVPRAVLHVIATRGWRDALETRGLGADRLLLAIDDEGRDVELNHFLESPAAVWWTIQHAFQAIVGSDAHNLYNEEVKDIFEQRALLLLGAAPLLAHTLPNDYVYVFDTTQLVERCGRHVKVQRYERDARAIVDDLYQLWVAGGRQARSDAGGYGDVMAVLGARMGQPLLDYDEEGPIPLSHEPIAGALAGVVAHHRSVIGEHDRQLQAMTALHAERSQAVEIRETLIKELSAERVEAVNLRDAIIGDLHRQLEPWHRKLRRRWAERRT
jgi:hypothetical protein